MSRAGHLEQEAFPFWGRIQYMGVSETRLIVFILLFVFLFCFVFWVFFLSPDHHYHTVGIYSLALCQEDEVPQTTLGRAICYSVSCFA